MPSKNKVLLTMGVTLFSTTLWLSMNDNKVAADSVDNPQVETAENSATSQSESKTPLSSQTDVQQPATTPVASQQALASSADSSTVNTNTNQNSTSPATNSNADSTTASNNITTPTTDNLVANKATDPSDSATVAPQQPTITNLDSTVTHVTNSQEFKTALNNQDINTIYIDNDITMSGSGILSTPARNLTIQSTAGNHFYIDFKGTYVQLSSAVDNPIVTYRDLDLYGTSYWGIAQTGNIGAATIILDNISYTGSQMIYAGNNQTFIMQGHVTSNSVPTYVSPSDNASNVTDDNSQQVFEIGNGGKVIFDENSVFEGTTDRDNVIYISGAGSVDIRKGAQVTFNPHSHGNLAQNTWSSGGGIYLAGTGKVTLETGSTLNINITGSGNDTANAIYMASSGSSLTVNDGATLNVTTNGNIKSTNGDNAITVGGTFTTGKNSVINIIGDDMGTYSGSLVALTGSNAALKITGSQFKVALNDTTGSGSGTGNIKLLNLTNGAHITTDNPEDFVLDAGKNTTASLISSGVILTLSTVSYVFTDSENKDKSDPLKKINLQIGNDNTVVPITDDNIEGIDQDTEQAVTADLDSKNPRRIEFVAAGDFVDIVNGSVTAHKNTDGSWDISGKTSVGDAYLSVSSVVNGNTTTIEGTLDSPYWREQQDGNIVKYFAKSDDNGNFNFTISADQANQMGTDPTVSITATKDFVYSDPIQINLEQAVFNQDKNAAVTTLQTTLANANDKINGMNVSHDAQQQLKQEAQEAYNDAINALNSATTQDDLTTATNDGVTNINTVVQSGLGQALSGAQTDALNGLQNVATSAKQSISGMNLTNEQKKDFDNQIQTAYERAAANINSATTVEDATKAQDQGISNIDDILQTANKQHTLGEAQSDALNALQTAVNTANQTIDNMSLSQEQEDQFKQSVKDKYDAAVTNVNNATSVDGASAARDLGISDINGVVIDATNSDLAQAKTDATQALQNAVNSAKQVIDNTNSLTQAQKDTLNQQVQDAYNTAADNVKNATSPASVQSASSAGVTNINSIANQAVSDDLSQSQSDANAALESAANKAITNIQGMNLDDDTKAGLVQQVNSALTTAKTSVNDATSSTEVAVARDTGVNNINNVQQKGTQQVLQANKNKTNSELADAAATAKSNIDSMGLSAEDTEDLQNQINAALQDAQNNVNNANSESEVTTAQTAGKLAMQKVNANAALQQAANKANTAIDATDLSATAKNDLKQQVSDKLVADKSNINNADTSEAVTNAQDNGVADIKSVQTDAGNQEQALTQAKNDANNALQQAVDNTIAKINQSDLPESDKTNYVNQVNDALDTAKNNVNTATSTDDVTSAQTAGELNIQKLSANTSLQQAADKASAAIDATDLSDEVKTDLKQQVADKLSDAKTNVENATTTDDINNAQTAGELNIQKVSANAALQQAATEAQNSIDQTELSDTDKNNLKSQVDSALTTAQGKVNSATTSADVTTEQNTGTNNINDVKTSAANQNGSLQTAQNNADTALDNKAQSAKDAINATDLSADDKQALLDQVDSAVTTAKNNIAAATTPEAVTDAQNTGELNIQKVSANAALEQAATEAKNSIDQTELSDADKNNLKSQVDSALTTAQGKVNSATTSADVTTEQNTGTNNINDVKTSAANQNGALQTAQNNADTALDSKAQSAKDAINATDLSADDKQALLDQVDSAVTTAKNNIAAATTPEAVTDAQNTGELNIQKVNANAALQQAATEAKNSIDQTELSDTDKNNLKSQVDSALTTAQGKVNSATTSADVTTEQNTGTNNINDVKTSAANQNGALQTAQNNADTALDSKAQSAKDAINATDLSADDKQALLDQVDSAVTTAKNNIAAATTPEAVTDAQNTGELNIQKVNANAALQQAAQQADADIDQTSLSEAAKSELKGQVNDKLSSAKAAVNSASTNSAITDAKNDGVSNIESVQNTAHNQDKALSDSKTTANNNLTQAADNAKNAVNALNLSEDVKTDLIDQINSALSTAQTNVNNATSPDDVNNAQTAGELAMQKVNANASLQQTADDATNAIDATDLSDADKTDLKQQVADKLSDAKTSVDHATTSEAVTNAQTAGNLSIDKIKANATLQQDAKQVDDSIDQTTLSNSDKADLKNQVEQALTNAQNQVASAIDSDAVNTAQAAGSAKITNIQNDADKQNLEQAQAGANAALQQAYNNANAVIDNLAISSVDKAAARQKLQNQYKGAKANIDHATTSTEAQVAGQAGAQQVQEVVSLNQDNNNLDQAKTDAHQQLDSALAAANSAISGLPLSATDKQSLRDQVQNAYQNALNNVQNATTATAANTAANNGVVAINEAVTQATTNNDLASAQQAALSGLDNAKTTANQRINALNVPDSKKKTLRDQVNSAYTAAKDQINAATTSADAMAAGLSGNSALDAIANSIKGSDIDQAKQDALNSLANTQNNVNAIIDNSNLSSEAVTALKQRVKDEFAKASTNVNNATTQDGVGSAANVGISNMNGLLTDQLSDGDLADVQAMVQQALAAAKKQAMDQVAGLNGSTADKQALETKITQAYNDALNNITSAPTNSAAIAAAINGIDDINANITDYQNQHPSVPASTNSQPGQLTDSQQAILLAAGDGGNFVQIYDQDGQPMASDTFLTSGSWFYIDKKVSVNGEDFYRISPHQFVKASDIQQKMDAMGTLMIAPESQASIYDANGQLTATVVPAGSQWIVTDKKKLVDGQVLYQIGDNQYVHAEDIAATLVHKTDHMNDIGANHAVMITTAPQASLYQLNYATGAMAKISNWVLPAGTSWQVGVTVQISGQTYYRVSTNAWVKSIDGLLN
ncbi:DUF1542 domain-containing protein [Bombilactobacillus thymidiniphilus]|uniref:DUF1542 domain-containing protein n=1 Tax=Bombilactobacillus thymidiniphilus TaxID=2923363 RepID=A0ABY4PBS7_9LACO|nr:DUF1542 domain-containing protein [Bombilactobacillus thymidiniphilus]UQS83141.1 DUF1542 domain-containing protein [Bombilactobacillus thymidiniphilus]